MREMDELYRKKCEEVSQLKAELAAERQKHRWIPVEEKLPEKFCPVIICRDLVHGEIKVEQGYKDVGDWWKVYGTRTKKVTHWMPLPEFCQPEKGGTE